MVKSMAKLIYLASPYSAYKDGKEAAFQEVCAKAAELMLQGHKVFCPIAHSHPIEWWGMGENQTGDFWLEQDFAVLQHCDEMWVYQMPGWENSYGIEQEISFAQDYGIPILYIKYAP